MLSKMGKLLLILVMLLYTVCSVFAELPEEKPEATIVFNLGSDGSYLFGFSAEEPSRGTASHSSGDVDGAYLLTFDVGLTGITLTFTGTRTIYLFYKIATASTNVSLTLSIDSPFYFYENGTTLDEGEKINYKATVSKGSVWEGSAATTGVFSSKNSGFVLDSITNKELEFETNVKGGKSTFETFGTAKVEIELNDEDIGSRNPNGVYKTTMTLTLKNGG